MLTVRSADVRDSGGQSPDLVTTKSDKPHSKVVGQDLTVAGDGLRPPLSHDVSRDDSRLSTSGRAKQLSTTAIQQNDVGMHGKGRRLEAHGCLHPPDRSPGTEPHDREQNAVSDRETQCGGGEVTDDVQVPLLRDAGSMARQHAETHPHVQPSAQE